MGWLNIFTIRVEIYNPFCNKNTNSNKTVRNEKRKYKIDLNTTGLKTL